VYGSAYDQEQVDIVAMKRVGGLSAENRCYVYDALVNRMIEGWTPNRESVSLLIDVTAGRISHGEYVERILRRWTGLQYRYPG
jgi:Antitoxin VbhA